ncbi:toll/interleukin-1 receptor domain-containing protein [Arenimonas terrae]|uniref:Toll/interleukin-1 receptor domain-containing protein n=1 Tax=Arenimonas terrae TaxID=2546226 RepID=A0A5C4RW22_9GAMM|nr:toll/interleukin-1 receptor domain-containing protein [Arenimonas terrae]TNJ35031.1 toll/interleukin-1 receptor domain-containing protein [Arenimonas terrae]
MADVFVSYASADRDVAFRIVGYLEEQGIRCWVAPRDVGPGVEYGEAIIDAIGEARALVLVLSDQSNESQFVRKEVERAVSKTKPVLPVRIREVTPSGALEFYISSAQWVDAWKSPMEQHLLPLVAAIKAMGAPGSAPVRSVAPPLATPRAGARHGVSIGLALVAVAALGAAAALWFARAPAPAQAPEAEQRSVPAAAEPSSAELAEAAISAQEAPLPADAIENVEAATEAAAAAARSAPPAPAPAPAVTQVAPVPAGPSRSDVAFFTGTWCQPYNGLTIVYEVIRTGADTVLTRVDHPQAAPWDVPSRIVPVAGGFEMQPVDEPVAADNTARFEIVDDSMMKLVFANGAVEDGSILRMRCDGRKD